MEGKMFKRVIFSFAVIFAAVATLALLGSSPAPAQEAKEVTVSTPDSSADDVTELILACHEEGDIQAVLDALKADYATAYALANQFVASKKCDYAWELGYSGGENSASQCQQISEKQCFKVVFGYVTVIDENQNEDKHAAYMLVPPNGQYSKGPESSGPQQLVWPSPIARQ